MNFPLWIFKRKGDGKYTDRAIINLINGNEICVYRQGWMDDYSLWQSTVKQLKDWFGQKVDKATAAAVATAVASQPSINSVDYSYFAQLQNEFNDLIEIAKTNPYEKLAIMDSGKLKSSIGNLKNVENTQGGLVCGGGGNSNSSSLCNVSAIGGGGGVSYSYIMDDYSGTRSYSPSYEKAEIILNSLCRENEEGLFGYKCTLDPDGCYHKISKDNKFAVQIKTGGRENKREEFINAIIEIEKLSAEEKKKQ